jgi:hypothetical protein
MSGYERDFHWSGTAARITVNEAMKRWPTSIPLMQAWGIQAGNCGGLTLAAVAERNNLDVSDLLKRLRRTNPDQGVAR